MSKKYVYLVSEGDASMRNLLGGKGANLAEMTKIGLPVPQGFTITTEAVSYTHLGDGFPAQEDLSDLRSVLLYFAGIYECHGGGLYLQHGRAEAYDVRHFGVAGGDFDAAQAVSPWGIYFGRSGCRGGPVHSVCILWPAERVRYRQASGFGGLWHVTRAPLRLPDGWRAAGLGKPLLSGNAC